MTTCGELSTKVIFGDLKGNGTSKDANQVITGRDASWILTSTVIIFTMQTGFGLLESGCVSRRNEVSIMVKNTLDVVFGGVTYWAVGFGLTFGTGPGTNPFFGVGCFLVDTSDENMGYIFSVFIFQLSFATTATTIVSGAMADRTRLHAYIVFSMVNTIVYSIPAHWVWAETGFLHQLGALDVAGCGPVHLVGGATGLVATVLIGPRAGAFDGIQRLTQPTPLKAILGMFMLWWAWLRFNSGSVLIVSSDTHWQYAVRGAVNTILSSMAGGISGVLLSVCLSVRLNRPRYDIATIINGILGSLVAITGICTLCRPWEALVIGTIATLFTVGIAASLDKVKIDDPVGVIPVHLGCGVWGLICIGLFVDEKHSLVRGEGGLFRTGRWYLLGIQTLAAVSMFVWTIVTTFILLKLIDVSIGLRLTSEQEATGCDVLEHGVHLETLPPVVDKTTETADPTDHVDVTNPATIANAKSNFVQFFADFMKACDESDLRLDMRMDRPDTFMLEVTFRSQARLDGSVDSGIDIHL